MSCEAGKKIKRSFHFSRPIFVRFHRNVLLLTFFPSRNRNRRETCHTTERKEIQWLEFNWPWRWQKIFHLISGWVLLFFQKWLAGRDKQCERHNPTKTRRQSTYFVDIFSNFKGLFLLKINLRFWVSCVGTEAQQQSSTRAFSTWGFCLILLKGFEIVCYYYHRL